MATSYHQPDEESSQPQQRHPFQPHLEEHVDGDDASLRAVAVRVHLWLRSAAGRHPEPLGQNDEKNLVKNGENDEFTSKKWGYFMEFIAEYSWFMVAKCK